MLGFSGEKFTGPEHVKYINSISTWARDKSGYKQPENALCPRHLVLDCVSLPSFNAYLEGKDGDRDDMKRELLACIADWFKEEPKIGAIVIECSVLAGYSNDMRRIFGVPVHDGMTTVNFMLDSLNIMQRLEPKL